jgi:Spy/CpxP family protein refolding chaperone
MRTTWLAAAALLWVADSSAAESTSPYAGQEAREIKALSTEEIRAYLAGEGMGFAKVAELNHYPGPKHVLELGDELRLTEEQRHRTQALFDEMRVGAVQLGERLVTAEAALDSQFVAGKITTPELEKRVSEIAVLRGNLRLVHLRAHLAQRELLTPEQVRKYVALRGYATSGHQHQNHAH